MESTTRTSTREAVQAISGWAACIDPVEWDSVPKPELMELMGQTSKAADRLTGLAGMLTATVERRNAAILVAGASGIGVWDVVQPKLSGGGVTRASGAE